MNEKILTIASISQDCQKVNLLGIVLHKSSVRRVESKDGQQPSRGVFSFVIRDNVSSWININYWGTFKSSGEVSASFSIGDVVLVLQGQAKVINEGSYEDVCMVQTPSRFSVILNEGRSRILPYSCSNKAQITKLQTELLCPAENHLALKQVIQYTFADSALVRNAQSQQMNNSITQTQSTNRPVRLFTFFAAVMDVGEIKSVVLNRPPQKLISSTLPSMPQTISADDRKSYQRVISKCEVKLIDETCGHFPMILWNEDLIMFALRFWKPRVTVLSIVDCPVRYDTFRRGVVAVPNDRTVIITMPSCGEALRLAQYAKYSGWSPITGASHTDAFGQYFIHPLPLPFGRVPPEIEHISLAGIHTVRTIQDIVNGKVSSGFGIVFAMFTKLSLDIDDAIRLVRLSCSNCQRRMQICGGEEKGSSEAASRVGSPSALFTCLTPDCPLSGQRFEPSDSNHVLVGGEGVGFRSALLVGVVWSSGKRWQVDWVCDNEIRRNGQAGICFKERLFIGFGMDHGITVEYNVFLNLTDHTGTYTKCTLTNSAVEKMLEMQAKDFLQLSPNDRGRMKWKLLLNRFKVYFWMRQPGYDQPTPYLNVLACERPNPFEVYSSLRTTNCP